MNPASCFCPIRWTLSIAWASADGFHAGSTRITRFAPVTVSPVPPTCMLKPEHSLAQSCGSVKTREDSSHTAVMTCKVRALWGWNTKQNIWSLLAETSAASNLYPANSHVWTGQLQHSSSVFRGTRILGSVLLSRRNGHTMLESIIKVRQNWYWSCIL